MGVARRRLKAATAQIDLGPAEQSSELIGMDQRSDFISDFRARRIRTQITWEILLANSHEATVTYLKPVPPHARRWPSARAGNGNEP
jgi:hypothetical protein